MVSQANQPHLMESLEKKLKNAKAENFTVIKLLGVGKHGLVVKAKLETSESGGSNDKTYAVKLLFNFTHEYTSVISNKFENEWLVLSRLLPHPNIVRYWSQFVSPISQSFIPHIPNDIRKEVIRKKGVTCNGGGSTYRSGQFLVFDCHPSTLSQWLVENRSSETCISTMFFKFSLELLEAVNYLQQHNVCHLDLKLDNVLVSKHTSLLLCDFGCAIQFEDSDFQLHWMHGASIGGNRAHLSPEVLTGYHQCRTDPTKKKICYKKQASFAVGVLIHEIVTGHHPIDDYPLSQMHDGIVSYPPSVAMATETISQAYPYIFQQTVNGLLHSNPSERMDISEALLNIKGLLHNSDQSVNTTKQLNLEEKIQQLFSEKQLAEERIKIVAMERDRALKEMKTMAEQCQEIVKEFESLAKECDGAKRQLKLLQKEKAAVEKASEGAFQAYDILKEQLHLVARERDIAKSQVEELRHICLKLKHEGGIRECVRCKSFFLDTDQKDNCCWHKGVC